MKIQRQQEISLKILKQHLKKEGVRLAPKKMKKDIGNLSKEVGIPVWELKEFGAILTQELLEGTFK